MFGTRESQSAGEDEEDERQREKLKKYLLNNVESVHDVAFGDTFSKVYFT